MSFQWVNHSTGAFGSTTSTNVGSSNAAGANGTFTSGDMLLAMIYFDNANITSVSTPTGWTQIAAGNDSTDGQSMYTFYKVAGASETGSYTFSWTGSAGAAWILADYGALSFDAGSCQVSKSSTTSINAPSVNASTSSDTLVVIYVCNANTAAVPGTFTSRFAGNLDSFPDGAAIGDKVLVASGATGNQNGTAGATFKVDGGAQIALQAVAASGLPAGTNFDYPNRSNIFARQFLTQGTAFWFIGQDQFFGAAGQVPSRDLNIFIPKRIDVQQRSHIDQTKTQLIGQDAIYGGPGQVPVYDLSNPTPRKGDNAVNRTWLQTLYTFFLPNPFGPFDWPNPVRRLFRLQDHSEETQAQLIGQDAVYGAPGQVPVYDTSNPQARKADNAVNRSWLVNLLQATLGIVTAPFGPFDWPNPVQRLFRLQDHNEATQAQLIGTDVFYGGAGEVPTHEHSVANPVLRKPNFELRTWLLDIIQILTTIFPKPPLTYDWPNPGKFVDQLKAWARIAGDAQQLGPTRPLPKLAQPPAIPPVPHSTKEPAFDSWITQIARNANLVLSGKINATARVVLNPGQDNTVLNDSRIGALSHITLTPLSASAADVLSSGLIWFEPSKGSVIIHHPVMGYFDASCSVLIVG